MFAVLFFQAGYRQYHGETAGEQYHSIDRPQERIQLAGAEMEIPGEFGTINRVKQEQTPEQKDFSKKKQPHADTGAGGVFMNMGPDSAAGTHDF